MSKLAAPPVQETRVVNWRSGARYDVRITRGTPYGNPFVMNTIPDLNPGDFIVIYSLNGTSVFTLSGVELT